MMNDRSIIIHPVKGNTKKEKEMKNKNKNKLYTRNEDK